MNLELEFCVKNLSKGETLAEFTSTPDITVDVGMWTQQILALGDIIEGIKFTTQVFPDGRYAIFIYSNFNCVAKTEYVRNSELKLEYKHNDGTHFFFAARKKPETTIALIRRILNL